MTKAQFLAATHSLTNFVPSVDLGAFDIVLKPKEKRAEIVVRVYLETQKPSVQAQMVNFGKQFTKLVPEVWNKKARFVCTKTGWTDISLLVTVKVVVTTLANAHYRIAIEDEDLQEHALGPFAMVTDKTSTGLGTNPAFAPRTGTFGSAATQTSEISSYRRNIIFDLSKTELLIPIKTPLAQDSAARQRLEKFAREIMQLKVPKKYYSSRRPTLTVNGCGPGNRATLASAATAHLRGCGIKNPIVEAQSGATTNLDGVLLSFDNTELKALFPEKPGSTKSLFRQITVAHEFGHMVGLPDEYVCMHAMTSDAMENVYAMTTGEVKTFKGSGMQIADVTQLPNGTINVPHIVRHQGAFVTLCSTAGLVPPEFGRMTPSMMSNGMVFHKHHFVTIWEAVCQASGFKDWDITLES